MTEPKQEKEQEGNPIVEVIDLNTNEEVKFHASWSDTLQTVWDKAYVELKEGRRSGDTFECQNGTSLSSHLGSTLEQLREKKILPGSQVPDPWSGWRRMAALNQDPVPSDPEVALAAVDADLPKVLGGKAIEEVGWQRADPLTLLIPMWAAFGGARPDLFLLKLYFGYYPEWPASAQFVNPITRAYDPEKDKVWLPRIEGNSRIQVHANYDGNGRKLQLICSSMTLEFYLVRHGGKEEDVWSHPQRNFSATINEIRGGLLPQWYQGRMS